MTRTRLLQREKTYPKPPYYFFSAAEFHLTHLRDFHVVEKRRKSLFSLLVSRVQSTTEPDNLSVWAQLPWPWKLMSDPQSSDPDCFSDEPLAGRCANKLWHLHEKVGGETCSQTPTALRFKSLAMTEPSFWDKGQEEGGGNISKTNSKQPTEELGVWHLTLTIFVFPWSLTRSSTSVYIYWPFGYSLLWSTGWTPVPIFLLVPVFVLTWELFILNTSPIWFPLLQIPFSTLWLAFSRS